MAKLRVCFIGDSITNGTGDAAMLGWPGYLSADEVARGHDMTDYNLGIRGDTSEQIRPRWRAEVEARLPARLACAIVFNFGINDATLEGDGPAARIRVELGQSIRNARDMLGQAKQMHPTLWVGPSAVDDARMPLLTDEGHVRDKRNARSADYNLVFRALADELKIPYLDMLSETINDAAWPAMLADGLHPLAEGHRRMAEIVAAWPAWRRLLDGA